MTSAGALARVSPSVDGESVKVHAEKNKRSDEATHYLDRNGRDLTQMEREGKLVKGLQLQLAQQGEALAFNI